MPNLLETIQEQLTLGLSTTVFIFLAKNAINLPIDSPLIRSQDTRAFNTDALSQKLDNDSLLKFIEFYNSVSEKIQTFFSENMRLIQYRFFYQLSENEKFILSQAQENFTELEGLNTISDISNYLRDNEGCAVSMLKWCSIIFVCTQAEIINAIEMAVDTNEQYNKLAVKQSVLTAVKKTFSHTAPLIIDEKLVDDWVDSLLACCCSGKPGLDDPRDTQTQNDSFAIRENVETFTQSTHKPQSTRGYTYSI